MIAKMTIETDEVVGVQEGPDDHGQDHGVVVGAEVAGVEAEAAAPLGQGGAGVHLEEITETTKTVAEGETEIDVLQHQGVVVEIPDDRPPGGAAHPENAVPLVVVVGQSPVLPQVPAVVVIHLHLHPPPLLLVLVLVERRSKLRSKVHHGSIV